MIEADPSLQLFSWSQRGLGLRSFCVFEDFMSWDLGHETNPKSVKGRPDRAVRLGKPHEPGDPAPIDKTIDVVAMTGRQKCGVLGVRRTPAREHHPIL
jgi:hypothetical protein